MNAYGLNLIVSEKEKTKDTNILSAFLKGNTKEHLLMFYADNAASGGIAKNDVEPFIRNTSVLVVWSADFFKQCYLVYIIT